MLHPIPYSFLCNIHIRLTWHDILWGYEHQLIGWLTVVSHAKKRVIDNSNDPFEIQLSNLTKNETYQVGDLLRELTYSSPNDEEFQSTKKWLYLELAWLFENRDSVRDPLEDVEAIYADFDYPSEVESFVRYMPTVDGYDPTAQTKEDQYNRLFENWRKYLVEAELEFKRI